MLQNFSMGVQEVVKTVISNSGLYMMRRLETPSVPTFSGWRLTRI